MRKLTILLITLMLALFAGVATAQETPAAFCGDLDEAACAPILLAAETTPDSAEFEFDGEFILTTGDQATTASFDGSGSYSITDKAPFSFSPDMSTAFFGDTGQLTEIAQEALLGVNSQMTVNVELPEDMGLPASLQLDLFLDDGIGYIDFAPLQELVGLGGIYGVNLATLASMTLGQQSEMMDTEAMREAATALQEPETVENFTTVERLDESTLERASESTATFVTVLDYGAFFSDEDVQNLLRQQFTAQLESQGTTLSAEEIDQTISGFGDAFEGSTATTTQVIGEDSGYVYSNEIALDMQLNPTALAPEDTDPSMMGESTTLSLTFNLTQSAFDEVEEITPPEDAEVVTMDQIQGFLMGGGQAPSTQ